MLKHLSYLLEVAFAKASRDENLNADGKAHSQSGEHKIIETRHHGGTQLNGAQMAQKGGVGKSDDGLRQIAQHDWRGDAPNLTIRNGSL